MNRFPSGKFKSDEIIVGNISINKVTLTVNNYKEVYKWLEDENQIVSICHDRKNIWISLDGEDIEIFHNDLIVKIGNEFRILSPKGFLNLVNELQCNS